MKIKISSDTLLIRLLATFGPMLIIVINFRTVKLLLKNKILLMNIAPMLIVIFAGAMFNIICLYSLYKDFITVENDNIIINRVVKKCILNVHDIKSVELNETNMTFYMVNGAKKRIVLNSISKTDKLALCDFLVTKSIKIIM